MCGRFTLTVGPDDLIDEFQLELFPEDYQPSYNIAPTQQVLTAIHSKDGRRAGYMKWGLIPFWVKEPQKWKPFINARAETLEEKASFKHLLDRRRSILLADSFYEWKVIGGKKTPFRIQRKDGKPFAFAGLWDRKNHTGQNVVTCTIVTTEANSLVRDIHERMPVILENEKAIEAWMNIQEYPFSKAKEFLRPYPSEQMHKYPVSPFVNSPENNSVECIKPIIL